MTQRTRHNILAGLTLALSFAGAYAPGCALHAQAVAGSEVADRLVEEIQPYDDVRTRTWTFYIGGGVSGFHGMRAVEGSSLNTGFYAPDLHAGLKYNMLPYVRIGLNAGYTKTKVQNTGIDTLTTYTPNYPVGKYTDATLITKGSVVDNRYDQHMVYCDLNIDFSPISIFKTGDASKFNIWLGTGIGYLHGWNQHTVTTAYDEECVTKGDEHFNVFNHDYIQTVESSNLTNTLYVPFRVSLEYDLVPQWTIGIKGEYKMLPLKRDYTPKGIWSGGVTLAYNITDVPTGRQQVKAEQLSEYITTLNSRINTMRADNDALAANALSLRNTLKATKSALSDSRKASIPICTVFFGTKSSQMLTSITNIDLLKKFLIGYPASHVAVKGYASSTEGNAAYNKALSQQRAKVVANALINTFKIPAKNVNAIGCGSAVSNLYTAPELQRSVMIYFVEDDTVK